MKPTALILLAFSLFLSVRAQSTNKSEEPELKNTFYFKEEITTEPVTNSENQPSGTESDRSLKSRPGDVTKAIKLNNLGAESFINKNYDEAALLFGQAADLSPQYVQIQINLANALLNGKHYAEAVDICRKSIDANVPSGSLYSLLGSALYESGSYRESVEAYRKSLQITEQAVTFNDLGNVLFHLGDNQAALTAFESALKIKPYYPDALNNYGVALIQLNRYKEAVQKLQEAIKEQPGFAQAHNNLGITYSYLGRKKQALKSFFEAVRLDPGYGSAQYNLALSYLAAGNREKARNCLEMLKKLDAELAQKFQKEFYKNYVIDVSERLQ